MLYKYTASTQQGEQQTGTIDAASLEIAISSLQRRNLIIVSIRPVESGKGLFADVKFFERIKTRDVVVLSRQLSTLFEAKIPTLESFKLLALESDNPAMGRILGEITEDIQSGISISQAMAKHPEAFSKFYVSMIKAGEESGKMDEAFTYLADYLERYYELTSKVKSALTYPAFVVIGFFAVIALMMAFVVPKLAEILLGMGQEIPLYTQIIINISLFMRRFGVFLLVAIVGGVIALWRYYQTEAGHAAVSRLQLSVPFFSGLYRKFYSSRITDNLQTLLSGGISAVAALEFTADIVGNAVYKEILLDSAKGVQGGSAISETFGRYKQIPPLVVQMMKVGEQSGKLNYVLKVLAKFYKKEVDNSVDVMISLIEPALIMSLAVVVGGLFVAILSPIYNMGANI